MKTSSPIDELTKLEQLRIASLEEAARLSSLSVETLLRHHRDKCIVLAPRRLGMRVRDALLLSHKKSGE
jgi:hypothetical protein